MLVSVRPSNAGIERLNETGTVIDLDYSRERMLADIGAPDPLPDAESGGDSLADLSVGKKIRHVIRGTRPEDVLPQLDQALSERFAQVAPDRLFRDLLSPLKKAVGNAHKRGNRRDPGKHLEVEVVATPRGAFVEVTDEGEGFDVADIHARFQAGEKYGEHKGSGFRRYSKARSVVSFAPGGRAFRLRFLCAPR